LKDVGGVALGQLEVPRDGPDDPGVLVHQALPRPPVPLGGLAYELGDIGGAAPRAYRCPPNARLAIGSNDSSQFDRPPLIDDRSARSDRDARGRSIRAANVNAPNQPRRALVRRHGLSAGLRGHGAYFRLRDVGWPPGRPGQGGPIGGEGNLCTRNWAKDADLMSCYGNRTYAVLLVNSGRQAVTTAVPLALGPSVAG